MYTFLSSTVCTISSGYVEEKLYIATFFVSTKKYGFLDIKKHFDGDTVPFGDPMLST